MADTKITDLVDLPAPVGADLFAVVDDVAGAAETKKATIANVEAALTHDNLVAGTIASHDTTATGAQCTTLTDGSDSDALHAHATNDALAHAEAHSIASHNDTTATGTELETLTDASNADLLHAHEGTAIDSTGEGGGTLFLREDGDGTCSWQASAGANHAMLDGSVHSDSVADAVTRGSIIYGNATPNWDELAVGANGTVLSSDGTDVSWQAAAGGGDVTAAVNLTDETLVQGDGGAKGVKTTIVTAAQVTANTAKDTNVTTNLSLGVGNATTEIVACSDGTDCTLIEATTTDAGLLGADKWNEIVASTSHISANGSSHTWIDQDVTIASSPAFTSCTLTTPALGTPSAGVLTNCTALPAAQVSTGTFAGALVAADHGAAATDQIVNVAYGTGAAPAANTTTIGSLYVTHEA